MAKTGARGSRARSRFLAALGMTARKARARATARATATANAGVLRCAQDDGEEQTRASKGNSRFAEGTTAGEATGRVKAETQFLFPNLIPNP
jgi:hypothetical protein